MHLRIDRIKKREVAEACRLPSLSEMESGARVQRWQAAKNKNAREGTLDLQTAKRVKNAEHKTSITKQIMHIYENMDVTNVHVFTAL